MSRAILNIAEARKGYYATAKDFQRISRSTLNSGLNPELLGPLTRMAYHKIREGMATLDQFVIHIKQVWNKTDLTPEERDMVEQAWKKGGEDVETGVTYADEFNETSNVKPKENDNLDVRSLDVNTAKNLLSPEVLMSYEFYGIKAVRIKEGTNGKVAIIGQSMGNFAERGEYGVVDYARKLRAMGYKTELFAGPSRISQDVRDELSGIKNELGRDLTPSELETTMAYTKNMDWAKWVKEEGFTVIDIGNPNNKPYSHFYDGECKNIFGN